MHLQIGDDLRNVHNAQLIYLNHQDILWLFSLNSRYGWFITVKRRKTTLILKLLQLCYCIMPAYYLIWWKYVSRTIINLRSIPGGWQPLKKIKWRERLRLERIYCILSKWDVYNWIKNLIKIWLWYNYFLQ